MKNYEKPNIYIVNLDNSYDVLTTSGDINPDNDVFDIKWYLKG